MTPSALGAVVPRPNIFLQAAAQTTDKYGCKKAMIMIITICTETGYVGEMLDKLCSQRAAHTFRADLCKASRATGRKRARPACYCSSLYQAYAEAQIPQIKWRSINPTNHMEELTHTKPACIVEDSCMLLSLHPRIKRISSPSRGHEQDMTQVLLRARVWACGNSPADADLCQ